jgi:excisionase family DNA binding protein
MNENWKLPSGAAPDDDLTTAMVAEQYGLSSDHVRAVLRKNKTPARKLGRDYLVKRADWEKYEADKNPWGAARGPRKKKLGKRA